MDVVAPKHHWAIEISVRRALQQVFNPKEELLDQLATNSPFYDLAVEERLALHNPERPRHRHIDAQRRAIVQIRQQPLYHGCASNACAIKRFLEQIRDQLQPHGLTSSISMTS